MNAARPLDPRLTEQRNPRSARIDQLSTIEIVDLINAEDPPTRRSCHGARAPIGWERRDVPPFHPTAR